VQHPDHGEIPVIDAYTTDDAIEDGVLLDLAALAPTPRTKRLHEIGSIDEYLQSFGRTLGQKAIHALNPLHVPGCDPLPAFDDLLREPFPCQQHVIAAAIQMMDERGSGFLVGEMGCIAGESEVDDPVTGINRRVDQITEPFPPQAFGGRNEPEPTAVGAKATHHQAADQRLA
jgi:hypothetical protein